MKQIIDSFENNNKNHKNNIYNENRNDNKLNYHITTFKLPYKGDIFFFYICIYMNINLQLKIKKKKKKKKHSIKLLNLTTSNLKQTKTFLLK